MPLPGWCKFLDIIVPWSGKGQLLGGLSTYAYFNTRLLDFGRRRKNVEKKTSSLVIYYGMNGRGLIPELTPCRGMR